MLDRIKGKLIVSCQALNHEPLHSSYIMARMAKAAYEGGAAGIRANSKEDILEIKKTVDLPIIGIVKRDYENSNVYITPTMKEVDELVEVGVDMIALDATKELRPTGESLEEMVSKIKKKYPNALLMADCSTVDEIINAEKFGFDVVSTTLVGYTEHSKHLKINQNDFEIIREVLSKVSVPVIAEGNIDTPEKARRVLELGCHAVVVGSIITRPQVITKRFVDKISEV